MPECGFCLSGFLQGSALGGYHRHEFVPGFYERSSAFVLELRGQGVAVDSGLGELGQNRFAIPPIGRYRRTELAVFGKGFQRTLRHRVYRKWCDQLLDVEDVGGFGIFGSSAGKQESLWAAASIEDTLPARRRYQVAISFVGALADGDAELVVQGGRYLSHDQLGIAIGQRTYKAYCD